MSPFLRDVLNDVPIVDKMKLIIVPDVNASDVETFLGLVFSDQEQIVRIFSKTYLIYVPNNNKQKRKDKE